MKKIFILFISLSSITLFAQESSKDAVTVNRVSEMAIYPGCDEFEGNKRELIKCMGDKLSRDVMMFLDTDYPITVESIDKDMLARKIQFEINTEGEIVNISAPQGDKAFEEQALSAYVKLAEYLKSENKYLVPAKMENGSPVKLIFSTSIVLQNMMNKNERARAKKRLGIQSM